MRRFFGVVIGLTALAFAGAAPAATYSIEVNTAISGGDRLVEAGQLFEGFYESLYDDTLAYDGTGAGDGKLLWTFKGLILDPAGDKSADPPEEAGSATAWSITPDNPKTEVAFLDEMVFFLDPTEKAPSEIFYDKIDGEGKGFTTSREYFWIKEGDWTAYFRNANPGKPITVSVPGGYSHYGVAGVPIPPAFLLFGSALLGMGWLARRQRARKDREAEALAV